MQSGFTPITGSKIYWEKVGQGEPIVFVHADALDTRQWDSQLAYFSKKYTVIRYDIRGVGKSDVPADEPYSFSEDLYVLLGSLSVTKAHFVGLSLGAAIIIDLALTHPEIVRSLVLADAGISGDGFSDAFMKRIKRITDLAKSGNLDAARKIWLDLAIFDISKKMPNVWKQIQNMVDVTSGYRWYGINQPVDIAPPAVENLSSIKVPALVLVGEHDIEDFQRKSCLIHEKIPGSQFAAIPAAGHLSNMDNPEVFNGTVDSFLTKS